MNRLIIIGWVAIGWLAGFATVNAQISVENKIDQANVTIGDLITYTLTVTHDENVEVKLPGRAFVVVDSAMRLLPDDALNISDYQIHEPKEVEGKLVEGVEYVFSPFLVGKFVIASLTVAFKMPNDTSEYKMTAEPIPFEVHSLVPSEAGDIRDIKPQWEIERDLWVFARPILIGVISVVLLVLLIIIYKRWRAGKALLPGLEKPKRPPHEIALEQLDALINANLIADGKVKEFYITISDIIRHYIEGRYSMVALEMTTGQLVQNMKKGAIDEAIVALIHAFLNSSDMVKFAKYIPEEEENHKAIQSAYEIVNRTKIVTQIEEATAETESTEEVNEVEAAVVEEKAMTAESANETPEEPNNRELQ